MHAVQLFHIAQIQKYRDTQLEITHSCQQYYTDQRYEETQLEIGERWHHFYEIQRYGDTQHKNSIILQRNYKI